MANDEVKQAEEVWVNTTEGAEITGYHRDHVQKLARDSWKLPESERLIKIRKRSHGYDIWLPDLVNYIRNHGLGPYNRLKTDI
jgi:hypothetical protein